MEALYHIKSEITPALPHTTFKSVIHLVAREQEVSAAEVLGLVIQVTFIVLLVWSNV